LTEVANDTLVNIFQFLDFNDLLTSIPLVSKQFYAAYCDNVLWSYWCNAQYNLATVFKHFDRPHRVIITGWSHPFEIEEFERQLHQQQQQQASKSEDNVKKNSIVHFKKCCEPNFYQLLQTAAAAAVPAPSSAAPEPDNAHVQHGRVNYFSKPHYTRAKPASSEQSDFSEDELKLASTLPNPIANWYSMFIFLRRHCCYKCFDMEINFNMATEPVDFATRDSAFSYTNSLNECSTSPQVKYHDLSRGMLCDSCADAEMRPNLLFKTYALKYVDKVTLETLPFYTEKKTSTKQQFSPILLEYRQAAKKRLAEYYSRVNAGQQRNKKRQLVLDAIKKCSSTHGAKVAHYKLQDGALKEYIFDTSRSATASEAMKAVKEYFVLL